MPIALNNPKSVINPEIPYDKVAVSLAISPVRKIDMNDPTRVIGIEAAMSLTAVPYRVLPDGTYDFLESSAYGENCGACYALSETDPVMAAAAGGILAIIQAFLHGRGQ